MLTRGNAVQTYPPYDGSPLGALLSLAGMRCCLNESFFSMLEAADVC
jgi:hypothetical protein